MLLYKKNHLVTIIIIVLLPLFLHCRFFCFVFCGGGGLLMSEDALQQLRELFVAQVFTICLKEVGVGGVVIDV